MPFHALLIGLFLVQYVDLDGEQYNVLLQEIRPNTGDLVATWTTDAKRFKVGQAVSLRIEATCVSDLMVLREGEGKRGSPWSPEDDWYADGTRRQCTADKVEKQ